tara:strand:+ start:284 stop:514 length:231 start_codon:yes stop_codon:yes gene_type:complete
MMRTALKTDLKSKTLYNNKSFISLREKETIFVDYKFYQKLFVVLISLSSILIFPESPRELEKICENYNSTKLCNVW